MLDAQTVPLLDQDAQDPPASKPAPEHQAAPIAQARRALPLRNDTILGVCEGLGEELGFNPIFLRVAFAAAFYWAPLAVVGAYLALGLALALARWLYPRPLSATAALPAAQRDAANESNAAASLAA